MNFKTMDLEQHGRFTQHLNRIRRKYATRENLGDLCRLLKSIINLSYYAGRPVANIEYYPGPNVAVVIFQSDDPRQNVMTAYVRVKEIEFRYGTSSFAKFEKPREAAQWLQNF